MGNEEILIGIIPVGNVGGQLLEDITVGIKEVLLASFNDGGANKPISCRPIPPRPAMIPSFAYQNTIGKYNIEPFFELAMKIKEKADNKLSYIGKEISKVLIITNVPLYSYTNNCSVFGEAQINGKYAIVSLHHIESKASVDEIKERTIKECVHELGHTFGLRHCNDDKCVMRQSMDMYDVDKKSKYFCDECKRMLRSMEFSKEYRTWKGH